MSYKNTAKAREGGFWAYDFICEGCGSEGELRVPEDYGKPFGCPEGCGATYVQWVNPLTQQTGLMCVVRPVYAEEATL